MKDIITKEKVFNHSIDTIWNAITNADEISAWFIRADFKAVKGYNYVFNSEGEDCAPILGEVKSADPYTLSYTWIVKGTEVETLVTWRLEEVSKGTKLFLEHSGISNYAGETAVAMFESFNGGWDGCMGRLLNYLKQEVNAG